MMMPFSRLRYWSFGADINPVRTERSSIQKSWRQRNIGSSMGCRTLLASSHNGAQPLYSNVWRVDWQPTRICHMLSTEGLAVAGRPLRYRWVMPAVPQSDQRTLLSTVGRRNGARPSGGKRPPAARPSVNFMSVEATVMCRKCMADNATGRHANRMGSCPMSAHTSVSVTILCAFWARRASSGFTSAVDGAHGIQTVALTGMTCERSKYARERKLAVSEFLVEVYSALHIIGVARAAKRHDEHTWERTTGK
ncbi:hypothetical protein C8R47DRAFT_1088560 [Mycena vitilis]|nr:hypothetical protein C8R47DRAFT_1088560 [Mycena vitilis]